MLSIIGIHSFLMVRNFANANICKDRKTNIDDGIHKH